MKKIIYSLFFISLVTNTFAQGLTYGFKVGLSFNTLKGSSETDASGKSLDTKGFNTGFHIGGGIGYKFTDKLGIRGELLFNQKGGRNIYEGPAYRYFTAESGKRIFSAGTSRIVTNVSNSYFDLPFTVFYRPISWLEVSAGVSFGYMLSSTGSGEIHYVGDTESGTPIDILLTPKVNYLKDKAGESPENQEFITIVDGIQTIKQAKTLGAYADYTEKKGDLFNRFDTGLVGGASLYFNESLYIGGRLYYGLTDVTNNEVDFSKSKLDANNLPVPTNDADKNYNIQAFIGFNF